MGFFKIKFISILLFLTCSISHGEETRVMTWNYYEVPPFVTTGMEGLANDFVNLLNEESKGKYIFELNIIPRSRLNLYLKREKQGIVLFVNAIWMGKGAGDKYLWTPPIMKDRNEIISSKVSPVNYDGPESLIGLRFGAVRGRQYSGLEKYFDTGQIIRHDFNLEEQALKLILIGRIDVTTQPRSVAIALGRKIGIEKKLFFSPTPLFSFKRYILVTKQLTDVHNYLNLYTSRLAKNKKWKDVLQQYGLR